MSTAEEFVQQRNRDIRVQTAEKDTLEHQVAIDEQWIVNQSKQIDAKTTKLRDEGRLTEKAIAEERRKMIDIFECDAAKRVDQCKQRIEGLNSLFALPEQPSHVTQMLTNHFLTAEQRPALLRDAITGKNKELALALLHAPQTMTQLSPDVRARMTGYFMTAADQIKQERRRDLRYRGEAVLDAYENETRRLRQ